MDIKNQIQALEEAQQIIRSARVESSASDWIWQFLNHAGLYLGKQQSALCEFHFGQDILEYKTSVSVTALSGGRA